MNASIHSATVLMSLVLILSQMAAGQTLSGRVDEGAQGTEPPTATVLAGVTVTLYGSNDAGQQGSSVIATATTDSAGWYGVSVSGAFDYYNVVQTDLSGYTSDGASSVGGSVKSSNWIQYRYEDIFVTPVTMTGNKFWDAKDAAEPPTGTGVLDGYKREAGTNQGLENWRIYVDVNANGQWDSGEPSDLTDSTGYYRIADLSPGTYRVCEVMQSGWEPAGGTSTCVDAIDILAGVTTTLDFHNQKSSTTQPPAGTGTIRGVKYNDLNGNGQRDAGEPTIPGWMITIDLNDPSALISLLNVFTDQDGSYSFDGLAPGTYKVSEASQSGWTQTAPGGTGVWEITLAAGETRDNVDFGNQQTDSPAGDGAVIHGYKWNDLDGDGQWDIAQPVEPALAGWTIWLDTNGNGVQDAGDLTTQTDAQGHFVFPPVAAGTYVLGEVQQSGWTQTTPAGGTHTVTVQGGQNSFPMLFGNRQVDIPTDDGQICGSAWNDLNGDGVLDVVEPLLANWKVYLDTNQNGQHDPGEPSQLTDAGGSFQFAGLAVGTYTVAEEMQSGWQQTWPGGAGTHTITIQAGIQPACVLFGNQQGGGSGPGPDPDPDPGPDPNPDPDPGSDPSPDPEARFDWGDAPDPTYPTLRASNGAYHTIVPGFSLGSVDDEVDGQPHPDAIGDDAAGDDEDGVFFLGSLRPGAPAEVEIIASAAGKIDAWIDFDVDGTWAQASDQILQGVSVMAGSNVLTFSVPAGAKTEGHTYARIRFSSQGGLSPGGAAADGEVEDHQIQLGEAGPGTPHVKWSQPPLEVDPNPAMPAVFCGWSEPARSTQREGSRRQWRMDADDFRCLGPIPITRIRWWGSYKAWASSELPEPRPEMWHIGIWANMVEGLEPEGLFPERLVWSLEIPDERVSREPIGLDDLPERLPEMTFVYDVELEPEEWFHQAEVPTNEGVFWISITAVYPPDIEQINMWGWRTRPLLWGQGAVIPAIMGGWPDPEERLFPGRIYPVESSALCGVNQAGDLCFELLTEDPWVKWDQPFTGMRDWPWYADVMAETLESADGALLPLRQAADDWVCEREDPVIAVCWHGSYLGYPYEPSRCGDAPECRRPDYFLLSFWTSAPPEALEPHAHPGEKIWEYAAYNYDEVLVGYDGDPVHDPNEPVYRYSVRLPEEVWFRQAAMGTTYWFTVVPVFKEPVDDRLYHWGWTNGPHIYGEEALYRDYRLRTDPQWRPVQNLDYLPIDMSFTLYTAPGD